MAVQLLFLHGPAAAGKYTVGKELASLVGAEFYHNHLIVDEVLKHHAFGTSGFIAERDLLWREYFTKYPGPDRPTVIFTFNPEHTVPQAFIDWLFTELPRRGVRLTSVEIAASEAVIESRITSVRRRLFNKLTDVALYRRLRDSGAFATPLIPRSDLRIDTGANEPGDAAAQIAQHFGLG